MLTQKIRPYVLPVVIVLSILLHQCLGILNAATPFLIFGILLLTFCAADIRRIRPSLLDLWIALFQIGVSLGGYLLLLTLTHNSLLAEGLLVGVLCPVAASSTVVACALGADRQRMVCYTMVGNLLIACSAPIVFSFIGQHQDLPFLTSFWIIFKRTASVLAIPFFTALLLQLFLPKVNRQIAKYKGAAFYLWAVALLLTLGKTMDFIFLHGKGNEKSIAWLSALSLLMCILQFIVGKAIGRRSGDAMAGGQMLAQKNSAMGIWMANMYLHPLASVYVACYSIWQNIFNSWQLWYYPRKKKKLGTNART